MYTMKKLEKMMYSISTKKAVSAHKGERKKELKEK
jgi:hypothetical protein